VTKRYWESLLKAATFAAFFILVTCLSLSSHELSGTWSGSASRYFLGYLSAVVALYGLIRCFLPNRKNLALLVCAITFLFLAAGLFQVVSAIFVLLSCTCLGILIRYFFKFDAGRPYFIASTIIGAAVYILFFNVFLSVPIHYQFVYICIFSLPILLLLRVSALVHLMFRTLQVNFVRANRLLQLVEQRSFIVFLFMFTFVASYILFPTINSDENVVHLSVWAQFSANAFFTISPETQVWSAAPITLALIHGILSQLSGADAKGALNLILLVLLLGAIFRMLKTLGISRSEKLALVTLFLSTPLLTFTLMGLQTDLFLALLLGTACVLLIDLIDHFYISTAMAAILIGSIALSAKLPSIIIAGPVLICVIYAALKSKKYQRWGYGVWLKIIICLGVAAAVAFLPYVRAYLVTGNPVFPLYNEIFKSEFFDVTNFKDRRWTNGATLSSYYGLFFNSEKFIESESNFVGGFQYFLLFPIAIVALIALRIKNMGLLLFLSLCYLLPMFFSLQYLRYFFVAFPLLSVLIGVLYLLGYKSGLYRKWLSAIFYVIAVMNFVFLPGVFWLFSISPFSLVIAEKRTMLVEEFMPEQQLNREINKIKPAATVLFALERPFGATLAGTPIYNSWYANGYRKAIEQWGTADDVRQALNKWDVDFVYWDQKQIYSVSDKQRNAVRELLLIYGKPAIQAGTMVAFTIANSPIDYQNIFAYNEFPSLDGFSLSGAPKVDNGSIIMGNEDQLNKSIDLGSYNYFKYSVEFSCEKEADSFVAHIDFGNGNVYYKLIGCHEGVVSYSEVGLIPVGTKESTVVVSVHTEQSIKVHKLSLVGN
jgi:hypothetical protein